MQLKVVIWTNRRRMIYLDTNFGHRWVPKVKSQTRHKYDTLTNYDHFLLGIRRVEKKISINKNPDKASKSVESRGQRLYQHGISVENDVEERINRRIQNLQSEIEGKIDETFNQILKRQDTRRDDLRQNYWRFFKKQFQREMEWKIRESWVFKEILPK